MVTDEGNFAGLFCQPRKKGSTDMKSFHHRIKSGKKGAAADHAAYISREGKFKHRDEVQWSGRGNMPEWASDDPTVFWKLADKHERSNGSTYREHEIALPNELTREQQGELVDDLVRKLAGTKAHQYAVHGPRSSLEGVTNMHLHLMISDRMLDGLTRPPEQIFARFNPKDPSKGGCKKDSGGRGPMQVRDALIALRKMIAGTVNKALAKYGHAARVDHRTLKEQGIDRRPERHLGAAKINGMSEQERAQYVAVRHEKSAGQKEYKDESRPSGQARSLPPRQPVAGP